MQRIQVDGTDYFESLLAFNKAVDRARRGHGPTVIESMVVRLLPHSSSDDHRKYRSEEDINSDIKNDPLVKFEKLCLDNKILSSKDFNKIMEEVISQINENTLWAEEQDDPSAAEKNLFVDENVFNSELKSLDNDIVLVDAINQVINEELRYTQLLVYGQDVAGGKAEYLLLLRFN